MRSAKVEVAKHQMQLNTVCNSRLYVYWKHTLETLSFGNIICIWKHGLDIGNMKRHLAT